MFSVPALGQLSNARHHPPRRHRIKHGASRMKATLFRGRVHAVVRCAVAPYLDSSGWALPSFSPPPVASGSGRQSLRASSTAAARPANGTATRPTGLLVNLPAARPAFLINFPRKLTTSHLRHTHRRENMTPTATSRPPETTCLMSVARATNRTAILDPQGILRRGRGNIWFRPRFR